MSVTFRVALQGQTVPLRFQTVNFAGIRELVEADVTAAINARAAKAANGSDFATPLNGASGSGLVGWVRGLLGAITRTVQDRLRDTTSAFDFIPVAEHAAIVAGTSTYDASAALQAALDTGKTVELPAGAYQAAGLTMSTARQRLIALGDVQITKNANGAILSSSAAAIELNGIAFRGESASPAFTGDNISLTGPSPRLINCGSRYAFGRALKSTGNRTQIVGTCDIYQTADNTSAGYDIEIGVSGTATLYHHLQDVYSSQATGGILLTDTGAHTILGGEFGKLSILSGTSPAGVNGGKTVGVRVLGNVDVGLSGAVFSANQFGPITFTIAAGVSGTRYDLSNSEQTGFSMVNNGTVNQPLVRHDAAGAGGYITLRYGPSSSLAKLQVDPSNGAAAWLEGEFRGPHGGLTVADVAGTGNLGRIYGTGGTNLFFENTPGGSSIYVAGSHLFLVGITETLRVNALGLLLPVAVTPASSSATGTTGQVVWDANYIYVCTATNTWKRVAIATW
jgi:hypothetical protein